MKWPKRAKGISRNTHGPTRSARVHPAPQCSVPVVTLRHVAGAQAHPFHRPAGHPRHAVHGGLMPRVRLGHGGHAPHPVHVVRLPHKRGGGGDRCRPARHGWLCGHGVPAHTSRRPAGASKAPVEPKGYGPRPRRRNGPYPEHDAHGRRRVPALINDEYQARQKAERDVPLRKERQSVIGVGCDHPRTTP